VGSDARRAAFPVDVARTFPESCETVAGEDRPEKHEAGSGGEEDLFHRFRKNVLDLGTNVIIFVKLFLTFLIIFVKPNGTTDYKP
jgi:hypothetical protein